MTRLEVPVTCSGSGFGFVFDDLWQGVQNDAGWVEIGTSFCDQDDIHSKWVYAYYDASNDYYGEAVLQRSTGTGPTHTFKIWNSSGTCWKIYIDGANRVTLCGLGAGSLSNSATIGLEVTPSRTNSIQQAVNQDDLKAWQEQNLMVAWNGMDACLDTSSHIYPKWLLVDRFRHSLNVALSQSTC